MSSLCGAENLIGRTGHGNVGYLFNFRILWSAFMRDTHRLGLQRPRDSGGPFRETEMSWGSALYVVGARWFDRIARGGKLHLQYCPE